MKIKLEIIENEEVKIKEFSTKRMRGRALKRMFEVAEIITKANDTDSFEEEHYILICEFICEMFDNKFSVDELLDGIYLDELMSLFMNLNEEIGNKTMKKMDKLIKK